MGTAKLYKPMGKAWSDADVNGLFKYRKKCLLAGDVNAKNPV